MKSHEVIAMLVLHLNDKIFHSWPIGYVALVSRCFECHYQKFSLDQCRMSATATAMVIQCLQVGADWSPSNCRFHIEIAMVA